MPMYKVNNMECTQTLFKHTFMVLLCVIHLDTLFQIKVFVFILFH